MQSILPAWAPSAHYPARPDLAVGGGWLGFITLAALDHATRSEKSDGAWSKRWSLVAGHGLRGDGCARRGWIRQRRRCIGRGGAWRGIRGGLRAGRGAAGSRGGGSARRGIGARRGDGGEERCSGTSDELDGARGGVTACGAHLPQWR